MAENTLYNEALLLNLISQNDQVAFSRLFDHYRNRVYSIAYKLTKSNSAAEEVLQDVFLIIWERKDKLSDIHDFSAYISVVTRNHVYKVLKRIAKNFTAGLESASNLSVSSDASEALVEKELRQAIQTAIEKLPTQQKRIYSLIKESGMKREEVAHELNIHPETVKFHLAQAMKKIRAFCLHYFGVIFYIQLFLD